MSTLSDQAVPRGDLMRRLEDLERAVARLRTARRLEAASIGRGGLRVRGGHIIIQDASGSETMRLSTDDGVVVSGGGSISVLDGGSIRARHADGSSAIVYGSLIDADSGVDSGHGLLIQDDEAGGGQDIFRAKRNPDGTLVVWIASVDDEGANSIDEFASEADLTRIRTRNGGDGFLASFGGGDSVVAASDGGDARVSAFDGGDVRLTNTNFTVFTAYEGDSGVTANCHLTEDGQILRTSSSRQFKRDIRDAEIDVDAVLRLRPRTWLPADEVSGYAGAPPDKLTNGAPGGGQAGSAQWRPRARNRPPVRQVGLVAEEVDEVGLSDFVERGHGGGATNVAYERLTAALLAVAQRQQQQIDDLTQRLQALEAGGTT